MSGEVRTVRSTEIECSGKWVNFAAHMGFQTDMGIVYARTRVRVGACVRATRTHTHTAYVYEAYTRL